MLGPLRWLTGRQRIGQADGLRRGQPDDTPIQMDWGLLLATAHEAVLVQEIKQPVFSQPFLEVNDYACRLLGYQRERLLALGLGGVLWESDDIFRDDLAGQVLNGRPFTLELVLRSSLEIAVPLDVRGGVLRLRGRVVAYLLGREKTPSGVGAGRGPYGALYREVFQEAPSGLVACTEEGRMLRFNRAFVELAGFSSAGELRAMTNSDIRWLFAEPFLAWENHLGNSLAGVDGPRLLRCRNGLKQRFWLRAKRWQRAASEFRPLILLSIDRIPGQPLRGEADDCGQAGDRLAAGKA